MKIGNVRIETIDETGAGPGAPSSAPFNSAIAVWRK